MWWNLVAGNSTVPMLIDLQGEAPGGAIGSWQKTPVPDLVFL
jgi:hypothetical protein